VRTTIAYVRAQKALCVRHFPYVRTQKAQWRVRFRASRVSSAFLDTLTESYYYPLVSKRSGKVWVKIELKESRFLHLKMAKTQFLDIWTRRRRVILVHEKIKWPGKR
jgi:hypothetical protein